MGLERRGESGESIVELLIVADIVHSIRNSRRIIRVELIMT